MTRGIILAAGRGSRMGDQTAEQPKCFTKLHGRRLLDYQLAALSGAGIDQLAIVRGYRSECFVEPVHYFDNPRWAETNMVRSLQCAADWLRVENCVISYSDIFYSRETVRALADTAATMAIAYDPQWLSIWQRRFSDPLDDAETFGLHADETLAEIGDRPTNVSQVQGQYMGLFKTTPRSWAKVETLVAQLGAAADRLDMTSLLRAGLAAGWIIGTVAVIGHWGEIDSQTDLTAYPPDQSITHVDLGNSQGA